MTSEQIIVGLLAGLVAVLLIGWLWFSEAQLEDEWASDEDAARNEAAVRDRAKIRRLDKAEFESDLAMKRRVNHSEIRGRAS